MDKSHRESVKSKFYKGLVSDQMQLVPQPPLVKPYDKNGVIVDLPDPKGFAPHLSDFKQIALQRRSVREYAGRPLTLPELSYLLYMTQGVTGYRADKSATLRTVPSGGARHGFETYLAVFNVDGLQQGIWRYLPIEHKLLLEKAAWPGFANDVVASAQNQKFVETAQIYFMWSVDFYRIEWRYAEEAAKLATLDVGHVCQNLYLAAESIGCGACAIDAYNQPKSDELLGLDGDNECVIYCSTCGVKR